MSGEPQSVRRSIASGAVWMVSFRMCDRLIGVISTAVLARLLEPEHFGVIALAMSIIAVLDMVGEFGFELALIRDQEATEEHYDTAWTARVIKGLVLFGVLNAIAGPAANAFGEPRLRAVVHFLSFNVVLAAAQSIRITDLRKGFEFYREFVFRISSRVVGFVLTMGLAFAWRNHWALVYGTLATEGLRLVLSYVIKPTLPRLTLSRFGEIFDFSKWLVLGNVCSILLKRTPALIIGRVSGTEAVGRFSIANDICSMASTELVAPIKRAVFPGYSKLVSDYALLGKVYLENFAVILVIAMPVAAGIGVTAEFIVPLFLGPKWLAAIPVMQVLSVHSALRAINTNSNPLYYATNRPKLAFMIWALEVIVLLPGLWYAVPRSGAVGAATAMAVASTVVTFADCWVVVALLKLPWFHFLGAIWRTPAALAVMVTAVIYIKTLLVIGGVSSLLGSLIVCCTAGSVIYVAAHLVLWRLSGSPEGAESILLQLARKGLARIVVRGRALTPVE